MNRAKDESDSLGSSPRRPICQLIYVPLIAFTCTGGSPSTPRDLPPCFCPAKTGHRKKSADDDLVEPVDEPIQLFRYESTDSPSDSFHR